MSQQDPGPARLLADNFTLVQNSVKRYGVLDLACGGGRNGIFLARHNLPVVFADINSAALEKVSKELESTKTKAQFWEVDFEDPDCRPLTGKNFDAILVFNYLHRPLIPDIRSCLVEGGLLIYETFTVEQAAIGRPRNPDFLLNPGELRSWFEDWNVLHSFEGFDPRPPRHYANVVVQKPAG